MKQENVRLIGYRSAQTIKRAEDRLDYLKRRCRKSTSRLLQVLSWNMWMMRLTFANEIGYPVVVRPAYTLGGTGGGIAHNEEELHDICCQWSCGLSRVGQCLIERSIAGWKEIEYEVMRDAAAITVLPFVTWKILTRLVCILVTALLWHRSQTLRSTKSIRCFVLLP